MHKFFSLLMIIAALQIHAQEPLAVQEDFNIILLGQGTIEFPDTIWSGYKRYSDIWGYSSEEGTEYAILGTGIGTAIFDLKDPSRPDLTTLVPGTLSRWRDFKTYGHYIYAVADEGEDGLLVINMTNAPEDITWSFWKPELQFGEDPASPLRKCHNLYIDSSYLFLSGCNLNKGSVLIFDLAENPTEPKFISATDPQYSHDVFVQDGRIFSSDLGKGFGVIDISKIDAPAALVSVETSFDFTHNTWASDDGNYLFTTDERFGAFVDAYDISDLDEIVLLDKYQPSATTRNYVVPHNVHYFNGYLVVSYYVDGVKIIDAHEPDNLVEVGSFDTYTFRDDGYHGSWGAYPYLPSGLLLVSDIESGLFVFEPQYQRASYLNGTVTSLVTGDALDSVRVQVISGRPGSDLTGKNGNFKLGWAGDGVVEIEFSKYGYETKIVESSLTTASYTVVDVQLRPLSKYGIAGRVEDAETGMPIQDAQIIVFNKDYTERTVTDMAGAFFVENFEGTFTVAAGKWGYLHNFTIEKIDSDGEFVLPLERGYRDDFAFDYGWTVSSTPGVHASQAWDRGVPYYSIYDEVFANPNGDLPNDFGQECFMTGLAGWLGSNLADTSVLQSPVMDLSTFADPYINYTTWFYDAGVWPADDSLVVYLENGEMETVVDVIDGSKSGWRERSEIRVADYMTPSDSMTIRFFAADNGNVHIVEAGVDAFSVSEGNTVPTQEDEIPQVIISPNPFTNQIIVKAKEVRLIQTSIFNAHGQVVYLGDQDTDQDFSIDLGYLPSGIYFIQVRDEIGRRLTKRLIKADR